MMDISPSAFLPDYPFFKYDDRGNLIEWSYFDIEGKPTLHKDGYHKFIVKHDDRGNKIETAKYDKFGNKTGKEHFDEAGKTVSSEKAYFNAEGNATLHKDGYHKVILKYDYCQNPTEIAFFDVSGNQALNKDGNFHKFTMKCDEQGNYIEGAYFGMGGKAILIKGGFHRFIAEYDKRGNQTERACFNTEGRPTLNKDGYHKFTAKYDDQGNNIEFAYSNTEGKPMLHKEGYHKFTAKHDDQGNKIELVYFDVNGHQMQMEIFVGKVLGSQGEKLGIKAGDIFTHYDGKPVSDTFQFIATRNAEPQNSPPKELKVRRNEEVLTFTLSPGKIGVELANRPVPGSTPSSGQAAP